jgi:PAS domain S-box-containing protein
MNEVYKILIVDDEPNNIRAIRNCIAESGEFYTLYQALNGETALKVATTEKPDLIITDWEMPGMDGIELIKNLKSSENTSEIPVIMCTGVMTTSENLHTALMAGAVDYVRKPIDKIELIARVKSMLQLSTSKKELKMKYLEIEQNNKFVRSLMESIPHPMVYFTLSGEIKGCNKRFENLFGLATPNFSETSIDKLLGFSNESIDYTQDQLLLNGNTDISYETEFNDNFYIFTKTLYYSAQAKPEGIMCIISDITELKKAHIEIVESKKKELTSSALRLIQISELNNSLISEFEKIKLQTSRDISEMIQQTISKYSLNTGKSFWNEFESRFENVHESFYINLSKLYPCLSPGEKRLCALLRLNLTSKDIATLIYQNPQSVDMARYRLRKKLNLKQDENLNEFLTNID